MVTQWEVARACGLDVSSVNKILNRRVGPKFRKETVRLVFKVAKQLGYRFSATSRGALLRMFKELFHEALPDAHYASLLQLPEERVRAIRRTVGA